MGEREWEREEKEKNKETRNMGEKYIQHSEIEKKRIKKNE